MTDQEKPLVVYVDDEKPNQIVFEYALRDHFRIRSCSSGKEALELLESTEVAVFVSDMRMPGMTGEELLRVVRDTSPQTIRMVITAYADVDPILRAINEGLVARYIIKPWTRPELVQVLRWATEAWTFGRDSAALSRRLLETERLATLGGITGAVTHDLKQPLVTLDLNTKELEDMCQVLPSVGRLLAGEPIDDLERTRIRDAIELLPELAIDIRASALHLQSVTSTLNTFTRPPNASNSDPLPVLRHAMSVCAELAIQAHGSIIFQPHPMPRVRMEATALTQVLINVLTNSLHAIAGRRKEGGTVVVSANTKERMLVVEVRDDGVGMQPEVLKRVGTPFFTTRESGTGLGIAQCQRLVGSAGGRFQIISEPTRGTTVTISLPLLE